MAVHCTIVELLHTSRGNPRVKSPFGGCFWTKLQRPVRTIWKKKRMPSKLKTSKNFLWLEKNVYIQTSIDKKNIKKTIMWHGRFVSCNILFSCLFFFVVGMICSALGERILQLWPGHWKSLLSVPHPWVGGHVGSLRTLRQRQLGGEAFHAALPAKVSHLCHTVFIGGKENI